MKKQVQTISSPEELNKHLQRTSPSTWIVLGSIVGLLLGFFVWAFVYKFKAKITGSAIIESQEVTLNVSSSDLAKLEVGQKVYINDKEGEILSFNDNGQPKVSSFTLSDGSYTYTIFLKEMRPIDFLLSK